MMDGNARAPGPAEILKAAREFEAYAEAALARGDRREHHKFSQKAGAARAYAAQLLARADAMSASKSTEGSQDAAGI